MKRYDLTRTEQNQNLRRDSADLAERIASEQYADYSRGLASDFDMARESGAVGEVKSTATRLGNGHKGRFRLFKEQHESLLQADRDGTADYVFVLFDVSSSDVTARLVKRKPSDVGSIIGARGGWNKSGHSAGPQHKLPYDTMFKPRA